MMTKPEPSRPRICDYEGSNYRTEFWENQGRDYEDRVERIALRKLLPASGQRLLEVGAGFGRLTAEYAGYEQVILLDYSLSQLQHAQDVLGRSPRFVYVAADAYHLPFTDGAFDGVTMVRVLHHMANVQQVLSQIRRVMATDGTFILEFANKRNVKAILRHALKQQKWNPNDLQPVEFVELNFDFHPDHIRAELAGARFELEQRIPVSYFRFDPLKRFVPTELLIKADQAMQKTGWLYSPSIFSRSRAVGGEAAPVAEQVLACPRCGNPLTYDPDRVTCQREGLSYAIRDGIYDFKAPLDTDD